MFKSILLRISVLTLATCLPAISREMCRYPIEKEVHEFTIVDITGLSNPNWNQLLKDKQPTIICASTSGDNPNCSTSWGGKVFFSGSTGVEINGFEDKEGRLIDLRNQWGVGQLQFRLRSGSYETYACGQIESMGVEIGEWFETQPELVGDRFSTLKYKVGSSSRSFNAKKQFKVIYGTPSSLTSGERGAF